MADSHLRITGTKGTTTGTAGATWLMVVLAVLAVAVPQPTWAQRALIGSEGLDRFPLTDQDQKRAQAIIASHPSLRGQTIQVEFPPNAGLRTKCEQTLSFENPKRDRMWGNVQVLARCDKPSFSASIPLRVRVFGQSIRAARYLPSGARLGREDLVVDQTEITDAPPDAA
ncbi:MAG: hypothetical protein RLZZ80_36, partial [Pseudomonadota bacterium]